MGDCRGRVGYSFIVYGLVWWRVEFSGRFGVGVLLTGVCSEPLIILRWQGDGRGVIFCRWYGFWVWTVQMVHWRVWSRSRRR